MISLSFSSFRSRPFPDVDTESRIDSNRLILRDNATRIRGVNETVQNSNRHITGYE